jgi:fructoselysine-6-P-deglycase FrlB-like protein
MSDDRSWLTADFPELRDGPPWVMEEMILAEPRLPGAILGDPACRALGDVIRAAAAVGEPVVVTGCGTSEHAAMAVAELLAEALPQARVESRQALDAAIRPRQGGVCLGISHDGGTRATLLALEAAKQAGATVAAVTARADSGVGSVSDHVVVTPVADRSWCHTVAYVSAICAGAAIAGGADADELTEAVERSLALRPRLAEAAGAIHGDRRILTTGIGTGYVSARELALKIEEGARIPANAHQLETLLHGHLAGCDAERTAVVRFGNGRPSGAMQAVRGEQVDVALAVIGIPTVVIGEPLGLPPAGSAAEALIGDAVALQLLTLELAHAAGTNPDLIRREQRAYREAAEAVES